VPLHTIFNTAKFSATYPTPLLHSPPYTPSLFSNFLSICANNVSTSAGIQRLPRFLGDFHPDVCQSAKQPSFLALTDLQGRPGPRHCVYLLFSETVTDPAQVFSPRKPMRMRTFKQNRRDVSAVPLFIHAYLKLQIAPTIVSPTLNEIAIICNLFAGIPLKNADVVSLLKRCTRCRKIYLTRNIVDHVSMCTDA
jgi:hypothetical protein